MFQYKFFFILVYKLGFGDEFKWEFGKRYMSLWINVIYMVVYILDMYENLK